MSAACGATAPRRRLWRAPEVVQTSTMDCGPAALKCLLEGWRIPASYGRLREACQTDVDGTSIDTLETVAGQLGLRAEQVLVPADHVARAGLDDGPALVVVRQADGATHFVVLWRRVGPWVQLMDPALGRRWVRAARWRDELHRHDAAVPAADWRDWAGGDEHRGALAARMAALGVPTAEADALWRDGAADPVWFGLGALDAAVRSVQALQDAGAVPRGAPAQRLLRAMWQRTVAAPDDIHRHIGAAYWSVVPDGATPGHLRLRGAVLLRIAGRRDDAATAADGDPDTDAPTLSRELAASLHEAPARPWADAWRQVREGGRAAPLALGGAVLLATGAVTFEALLFRGLFELAGVLTLPAQRLAGLAALLVLLALLLAIEWPVAREAFRLGRHLELRWRMALATKLPRLNDRYFHSRPIADMADRAHALQAVRGLPSLALQGLQALAALALTLAALVWLAPDSAGWALALAACALALPLALQPLLAERDLRLRNHIGALGGLLLDALHGAVALRAHRAQDAMRRQHEARLADWTAAMRGWVRLSLGMDAVQGLLCTALAGGLLMRHFAAHPQVGGADLLLVYWTLKLPALGQRLAGLARQVPAQRNTLTRLMEPLSAPEDAPATPAGSATAAAAAPLLRPVGAPAGLRLRIDGGRVVAGGHTLLDDVTLDIAAGEQVAIVGASGAGKSTLLALLLGWHRLAAGELTVDGRPADPATVAALRRQIAWVDPAVQVWNHSLLDNLLYATPPDAEADADLAAVIDAARLRGVVQRLPQGLQGLLGEGGTRLSGGEGQRVRLGRALLAPQTRLVLLDEPFRGLDRGQRHALLAEARAWWQGRTLLCVTHDVGETTAFDRVLVVDGGRIVEDDTPARLAGQASRYRALLDAEQQVRQVLWQGADWRRLTLQDGRLHEDSGEARPHARLREAGR